MKDYKQSNNDTTAERFAALSRIGTVLMSELDESRLLHIIAETARDLTNATFAAFTLRPTDELGQPLVPSEGHLFHLAAVVGVTPEQEKLFKQMPLGGEGLLAPIFRHGVSVLVEDALQLIYQPEKVPSQQTRDAAQEAAFAFSHGTIPSTELRSIGIPRGHPVVRSFLGAPVLDRDRQVRGGLLLGHTEPSRFTAEDETLLVGLAAQAGVALENARLYGLAQMRAQQLNAIFESITDGVTLVDHNGTILRENETARRLREQLQSLSKGQKAIESLIHAPALQALHGIPRQDIPVTIQSGKHQRREYIVNASPLRSSVSGPLPEQTTPVQIQENKISGAVVVWHDVTEARRLLIERRVHAETEARLALLQKLLDELPGGVYLVRGPQARLVLANRATARVWGAEWKQGQPMIDFLQSNNIRIFGIDGRPLAMEQLATYRAVRQGETVRHHQEIIRHPDGTALPVLVNAVAIDAHSLTITDSKNPLEPTERAAIVIDQDVTALREAEQLKDEFIGIAAHELRTPLAILKGFAQTLIVQTNRGKGHELTEWQLEALEGIDQASQRMVDLIDDLLDVTRLQAGRLELHVEPNDLVALVRRVITRQQITTQQHKLILQTQLPYLVTLIDPWRIEQVITNLISNAIKYSPNGGEIEIGIEEEKKANIAVLSIHDYGLGIPAQQQARIFGRFMRADNVREHGIGGTGLGLYLSRELVEHHGGRIWFESVEGDGSTFFISLPLVNEDEVEQR